MGTTSAAQTLTLNNTGTASLSISSIVASGDYRADEYLWQLRRCGGQLHDQRDVHAHSYRNTHRGDYHHRQRREQPADGQSDRYRHGGVWPGGELVSWPASRLATRRSTRPARLRPSL